MYIYGNVSLNSYYNEKCFRQNCREKKTHFVFNNFFPTVVPFMK